MLLFLAIGCPGDCPECEVDRMALALVKSDGSTLTSDQTLADGEALYLGDDSQGARWASAVGPGWLLTGTPEDNTVRSVDFRAVGEVALDEALFGTLLGEEEGDRFGSSVATLGEALWVGAEARDVGRGRPDAGAAYLYLGLGRGFEGELLATDADLVVLGEEPYQHLGSAVEVCDDIDGDGLPDLLVTAGWDHTGANLGGRVFAVLSSERDDLTREVLVGGLSTSWWSEDVGARLGQSLACADLDGDGVDEVLLGAPYADGVAGDASGAVFVLQAPLESGPVSEQAYLRLESLTEEDYLGWSLDVGDIDGDGQPEVLVGAPGALEGAGGVAVFEPSGGLTTIVRGTARGRLGIGVRLADVDGDGLQDVLLGAPGDNAVYLFAGAGSADWPRVLDDLDADARITGDGGLGARLTTGDLDGDGDDDLVLAVER